MLSAVDGQRNHHYGKRGCDAGWEGKFPPGQEELREDQSDEAIARGNEKQPSAAKAFPAKRHEQRHCPYGNHAPQVVKDMRGLESWRLPLSFNEKGPKSDGLLLRD